MATTPKSYKQVHAGLFWAFGKAAEHGCSRCEKPAQHWCYLYTAGPDEVVDDQGRRYAEDFAHYAPMCPGCHKKFDVEKDPRFREGMRLNGARLKALLTPEQRSKAGTTAMAVRLQCGECDLVTTRASMGRHHKFSGHVTTKSVISVNTIPR